MKKEKDKGRKIQENGFTLIEVMVAICIFSIALLGIAALQLGAIKSNSSAIGTTEALNVAQNKMEELAALPRTDAQLNDTNGDGDNGLGFPTRIQVLQDAPAGFDHTQTINTGTRDYNVYWNVAGAVSGMRVRVIVSWLADGMHRIDLNFVKY